MDIIKNVVLGIAGIGSFTFWVFGIASVISFIRRFFGKGSNLKEYLKYSGIGLLVVLGSSILYGILGGTADSINNTNTWVGIISLLIAYGVFMGFRWVIKGIMRFLINIKNEIEEDVKRSKEID